MVEKLEIYLKAKSLPLLFWYMGFENSVKFAFGNLLGSLPAHKEEEKTEDYLKRLSPKQAVRYCRYHLTIWTLQAAPMRVHRPDLSNYDPESKETLEKLVDTVLSLEDTWTRLLKESYKRIEGEN